MNHFLPLRYLLDFLKIKATKQPGKTNCTRQPVEQLKNSVLEGTFFRTASWSSQGIHVSLAKDLSKAWGTIEGKWWSPSLLIKYLRQYRADNGWFSGSHKSPLFLGEAGGAEGAEPAMDPSAQKQDSVLEVILSSQNFNLREKYASCVGHWLCSALEISQKEWPLSRVCFRTGITPVPSIAGAV